MNTSSALGSRITQRRNSNSWFFRDFNNRSPTDAGLKKSRWEEFARYEMRTFSRGQFRGFALAPDRPGHILGRVALASMGLTADRTSTGTFEDVVCTQYQLTEHNRRILLADVRAALTESAYKDDTEDHKQEPRTEARGAQWTQPTPITRAVESPADDSLSAGRATREVQDDAAESPHDGFSTKDDWTGA